MVAAYPAYSGLSTTRTTLTDYCCPDAADWNQIVSEVVQHQTLLHGPVYGFKAVVTVGSSNVTDIAISLVDQAGTLIPGAHVFNLWLSDDTVAAAGLTAATASGTVTNKSTSGAVFAIGTAKKAITVQTLATGIFTLEITDTGKNPFVIAGQVPGTGLSAIITTLVTASYGP